MGEIGRGDASSSSLVSDELDGVSLRRLLCRLRLLLLLPSLLSEAVSEPEALSSDAAEDELDFDFEREERLLLRDERSTLSSSSVSR